MHEKKKKRKNIKLALPLNLHSPACGIRGPHAREKKEKENYQTSTAPQLRFASFGDRAISLKRRKRIAFGNPFSSFLFFAFYYRSPNEAKRS
jgi:hypothetical protein